MHNIIPVRTWKRGESQRDATRRHRKLIKLARKAGVSKAQVIRDLIDRADINSLLK